MTTLEHLQQERYTARALKSRLFTAWEASRAPPTGAPKSRERLCYPGRQTLGAGSRARHKAAVCAPLNRHELSFTPLILLSSLAMRSCALPGCCRAAVVRRASAASARASPSAPTTRWSWPHARTTQWRGDSGQAVPRGGGVPRPPPPPLCASSPTRTVAATHSAGSSSPNAAVEGAVPGRRPR
jgi:hypothetical protein